MSKIGIIIGREYGIRVRKKSFYFLSFFMPILFVVLISLPLILGKMNLANEKIAIIDHTGLYDGILSDNEAYSFVSSSHSLKEYMTMGEDNEEGVTAILEIRQNLLEDPNAWSLYGYKQIPVGVSSYINDHFSKYLTDQKLSSSNIEGIHDIIEKSQVEVTVPTYKWSDVGTEERTSGEFASFIGMALTIISFFFITTYGSLVMAGVLEEKKNRIMEVMVSSVKPFDMMMGKIIGIGLVGITQMLLWVILTIILLLIASLIGLGGVYDPSSLAAMQSQDLAALSGLGMADIEDLKEGMSIISSINFVEIFTMFFFYFIGGFMLYSSLYAAVGSSVNSDEEANQFLLPIMFIMMFGFYAALGSMNNPEGSLAFWGSIIPFTSPVVMMIRLPYDVPLWQEVLSIGLLYATFIFLTWVSAKIYRVGILMYGKKPSFKDLWLWFKLK